MLVGAVILAVGLVISYPIDSGQAIRHGHQDHPYHITMRDGVGKTFYLSGLLGVVMGLFAADEGCSAHDRPAAIWTGLSDGHHLRAASKNSRTLPSASLRISSTTRPVAVRSCRNQ